MRVEGINTGFLDAVLAGEHEDAYYHFGTSSADPLLEALRGVRAVVMAGSGDRVRELAERWSERNGRAEVIAFPKEDRFVTRYTAGALFASHGMGMPSASIAVQEAMRMVYFLARGDLDALDGIFWARVGTSGGVGLPGGTVVVSTEGLMPDLRPYRVMRGDRGTEWFDGTFPAATVEGILSAGEGSGVPVVAGRTVATNEFFLEQFRLDGALCLETDQTKQEFLAWLRANGVANIEMEGAMFAAYLNAWGFPSFAMVCAVLLDRLEGDQVTSTPEQLQRFGADAGTVLLDYLASRR